MADIERFFGDWSDIEDVARDFCDDSILDYNIIAAGYFYECYEGSAYVLAEKDGQLFEVEGGHCSCYGLEEQWEPGEVTVPYLRNRLDKGRFCYGSEEITEAVRHFLIETELPI